MANGTILAGNARAEVRRSANERGPPSPTRKTAGGMGVGEKERNGEGRGWGWGNFALEEVTSIDRNSCQEM